MPRDITDLLAQLQEVVTEPLDPEGTHTEADRLLWRIVLRLTDDDPEVERLRRLFEDAEFWYS